MERLYSESSDCSAASYSHNKNSARIKTEILLADEDNQQGSAGFKHGSVKYCGVCGDIAKSFHFGGLSCDSCKAFFRRSVQNDHYLTYECAHQGCCILSLANRKSCQYCRMKKCFNIGMEKSWVMTEEERKALMKARSEKKLVKQQQQSFKSMSSCSFNSEDDSYVPQISRMNEFLKPLEIKEIESVVTKYFHAYKHVPYNTALLNNQGQNRSGAQIMEMFGTLVRRFAYYARLIPDFASLPYNDQTNLLKGGVLKMCLLRGALVFDPTTNQWPNVNIPMYKDAPVLNLDSTIPLTSNKLFQMNMEFIRCIQMMNVDEPIIMLLSLVVLFNPDRKNLIYSKWIERYQAHYTHLLEGYMNWKFGMAKSRFVFGKLLTKLSDLRELSDSHNQNNLLLGHDGIASIQHQMQYLKLNPYPELPVVPESNCTIYPESGPSTSSTSGCYEINSSIISGHQQANYSSHPFDSPSTSRISTAANYYPNYGKCQPQQSWASDGNQQQASAQMTYQFMQAMEKSVNQVIDVPHFGFEWVIPDYQFDPVSPAVVVHERQLEPAAVEEPPKALTPRTMKELYDALEEYVDQVESV